MLIKMKTKDTRITRKLADYIKSCGLTCRIFSGDRQDAVFVEGQNRETALNRHQLEQAEGVDRVYTTDSLLSSRTFKEQDSVVTVKGISFGGQDLPVIMAGPCAIESYEQLDKTAACLAGKGVKVLRGGAYKPRTSPYAFQGLELQALQMAREVCNKYGLLFISEITDIRTLPDFEKYVDIIQVGARNSKNFALLKALGHQSKAVLLKRGMSDTLDDFLMAADYVLSGGNNKLILCERGIKGYDLAYFRNVLDMNALLALKQLTHLPVCFDPSHGSGRRDFIIPLCKAGTVLGADALLVEVTDNPDCALCDGTQSISFNQFAELTKALDKLKNCQK